MVSCASPPVGISAGFTLPVYLSSFRARHGWGWATGALRLAAGGYLLRAHSGAGPTQRGAATVAPANPRPRRRLAAVGSRCPGVARLRCPHWRRRGPVSAQRPGCLRGVGQLRHHAAAGGRGRLAQACEAEPCSRTHVAARGGGGQRPRQAPLVSGAYGRRCKECQRQGRPWWRSRGRTLGRRRLRSAP